MFRVLLSNFRFLAAVCAFAVTPLFAAGHGGGGHGGGGHAGGGHMSGGHIGGGHFGGSASGGFRSSGGSVSRGGGGAVHHAPSISGGASSARSIPSATSRPASPQFGAPSSGHHLPSAGHSALGGTTNPGFTQRHFSGSGAQVNHSASHPVGNNSTGTNSLINHTVTKPSFGSNAATTTASARHGLGGFGNSGQNINGFHHTTNNQWHNHPARRTSFFLGIGSPFGAYWGYPGYSYWPSYYSLYWSPWYRYGSFGSFGYGYAMPGFGYQSVCTYNNPYYLPATTAIVADNSTLAAPVVDPNVPPPADTTEQNLAALGDDFAAIGEQEFHAGHYDLAARNWRHALVDEPGNGGVMMLLAQALFATGKYDEAAGAVQLGMQMLPVEKWGTIASCIRKSATTRRSFERWRKLAMKRPTTQRCDFCWDITTASSAIRRTVCSNWTSAWNWHRRTRLLKSCKNA